MAKKPSQFIYHIEPGISLDDNISSYTVGSKAYNLMRLAAAGMNVPPAIVIDISTCTQYLANNRTLPGNFTTELLHALEWLEHSSDRKIGDYRRPLLVSVRSGAAVSMPGMMETVLNIGLNDVTIRGLIRATGNARMAWDSYRRLVQTYAEIVLGCSPDPYERIIDEYLLNNGLENPEDLDTSSLHDINRQFLSITHALAGKQIPQDPIEQVHNAVKAVFNSWMSNKAVEYRRINKLENLEGTAVIIQTMVFGNAGRTSGAGVGFTRDPASGEDEMYLDFLFNAQGEDVVAGRRSDSSVIRLPEILPDVYHEIMSIKPILENEFQDMQDFEYTVQDGKLYILQTRNGKRTPWAALKIAMSMFKEGKIDESTVLQRLSSYNIDDLAQTRFQLAEENKPIATAIPASIGVTSGAIALSAESAVAMTKTHQDVILVRPDTSTEDIAGIAETNGILTTAGFRTSHASVVARQLGKVCLVGCKDLLIDMKQRQCQLGGFTFAEGDYLSLDGNTGNIYAGKLPVVHEKPSAELELISQWRKTSKAV
jgi:pyruvate,orthophosphate dikinase